MTRPLHVAAVVAALAIGVGAALVAFGPRTPLPAPAVAYTLLNGRGASSDDWRGKVVLVNFWATSCAVCVHEMPEVAATWRRFQPRGFDTLAVAMRHDAPASVVHFAQTRGLPFGVAIDNTGAIAHAFGDVDVTPTMLLIDRRGRIVWQGVGAPDFEALHRDIERLLSEG